MGVIRGVKSERDALISWKPLHQRARENQFDEVNSKMLEKLN